MKKQTISKHNPLWI